jgi:type VI secretion system protein ImpF
MAPRYTHAHAQTLSLPSVLDRLLDDTPEAPQQDVTLYFALPDFKAALARDLESLLNTRVMELDDLFAQFPLSALSVIRYGIPDMAGLSLHNPNDRERLRGQVQYAIELYEPRLSKVRVTFNMPEKPGNQKPGNHPESLLHFRVDALLKIHPRRPPVSFDATLQLSSNAYKVREQM